MEFELETKIRELRAVLDISQEELANTVGVRRETIARLEKGMDNPSLKLAMDIAKNKGYKIVLQQIRVNNVSSIALHDRLGFETDEYVYRNKKGNEVCIYLKSLV